MAQFTDNFSAVKAKIKQACDSAVSETAADIAETAAVLAPKDTRFLSEHIKHQKTGFANEIVGTNTPYGVHQEFGTVYQSPQPFLLPAFLQHKDELATKINEKV
jgi:HK97 gp10 family phage protein